MKLSERLRFGPYRMRKKAVGDSVRCLYRQRKVVVTAISDAPIPWPRTGNGAASGLIVCDDLERAITKESQAAVMHHWGVSDQTVTNWRRALGVSRMNPGSAEVHREVFAGRWSDAQIELGRKRSHSKRAIAKMIESKRGKPIHPNTVIALRATAGKPKTDLHRAAMSQAHRKRGTVPPGGGRTWSEAEDTVDENRLSNETD